MFRASNYVNALKVERKFAVKSWNRTNFRFNQLKSLIKKFTPTSRRNKNVAQKTTSKSNPEKRLWFHFFPFWFSLCAIAHNLVLISRLIVVGRLGSLSRTISTEALVQLFAARQKAKKTRLFVRNLMQKCFLVWFFYCRFDSIQIHLTSSLCGFTTKSSCETKLKLIFSSVSFHCSAGDSGVGQRRRHIDWHTRRRGSLTAVPLQSRLL
jgi:hypothetical protein